MNSMGTTIYNKTGDNSLWKSKISAIPKSGWVAAARCGCHDNRGAASVPSLTTTCSWTFVGPSYLFKPLSMRTFFVLASLDEIRQTGIFTSCTHRSHGCRWTRTRRRNTSSNHKTGIWIHMCRRRLHKCSLNRRNRPWWFYTEGYSEVARGVVRVLREEIASSLKNQWVIRALEPRRPRISVRAFLCVCVRWLGRNDVASRLRCKFPRHDIKLRSNTKVLVNKSYILFLLVELGFFLKVTTKKSFNLVT